MPASSPVPRPNGLADDGRAAPDARYHRAMQFPADTFALFERVCEAWSLPQARRRQLLGDVSRATYASWRADPARVRLSLLQVERIAQVTSIANHLLAVYSGAPDSANTWVTSPNRGRLYGGRPPIELMASGPTQELIRVRSDLAAWHAR